MTDSTTSTSPRLPQMDGVLVLNKPSGPTSNRCVSTIKRMGQRKIGHAGTLDPMASGVLLVLLGQGTKLSNYLLGGGAKVYSGSILLGRETDTWDALGTVVSEKGCEGVTEEDVRREVAAWICSMEQTVPAYSAAKHEGQPLYKLARKGKPVPEKVKKIEISEAEILSMDLPSFRFRVKCSSGTYIRSLAHSLGMRLGCGAVLTELIREYSHPFGLADSVSPEELAEHPEELASHVHSLSRVLSDWPMLQLDADSAAKVRNGVPIPCPQDMVQAISANKGLILLREGESDLAIALLDAAASGPKLTVARGLWN